MDHPPSADPLRPGAPLPGTGMHVLVLEDAPINQKLAVMALQRLGARVTVEADGVAGLMAVRSGRHDLVLMDLHLPGLDGWGILSALLDGPPPRPVPVVVLTGDGWPGLPEKARAAGAADFVLKPIGLDEFRSLLVRHGPGGPC